MCEQAASNLVRDMPPIEAPVGSNPNQAIDDPSIQPLVQALARSEKHLASALHHIQRMVANNAHLQALVLERTREMEEAQHAADYDDLTGLFNRRLFPECLRAALAHAEQHQLVALVMLDLDGFRHVNDRFGHAAGDLVLRTLARRIAMNVGTLDTVCRYGGDEFVLILPDMDRTAAMRTVERITQQVVAPCQVNGHAVSLTMSVGIAVYPLDGRDAGQLLEVADVAMHRHKSRLGNGRKPNGRFGWSLTGRGETCLRDVGARMDERPKVEPEGWTGENAA